MVLTRYLDPDLIERAVESAAYTHVALTDPGRIDEAMDQVRIRPFRRDMSTTVYMRHWISVKK